MKLHCTLAALIFTLPAMAQNAAGSASVLNTVTVMGIKKQTARHSPFNIESLSLNQLQSGVHFSMADALAKLPGISQLSTGNGISKPVIRGLYGNRIQVVMLGLRFDNQQWQDEHGLGLGTAGIDHIEILKGPYSLLYGPDAVGGVIRVIEEKKAPADSMQSDISTALFSNTAGFSADAGMKKNTGTRNWRVRVSADSHADYNDGNNKRILNSRFASYNAKISLGFNRKKWNSLYNFYSSFGRFGFITKDNTDKKTVDARLSRKFDGPNHTVFFTILSSENTRVLQNSRLEINGGIHSNLRMENEGGNHVSLNMLLTTFTYSVKWFTPVNEHTELVLGNESQYQLNTNYGSRVIVPDARVIESSLTAYLKKKWQWLDLETGISVSNINISTSKTLNMDYSSGAIYPFSKWRPAVNGNAGIAVNTLSNWNFKLNASTGYRAPNLAELSSNGLHEGTFRYETGNPDMKTEQNLHTEININYESRWLDFYLAAYLNLFHNYIYLSPSGTQLYGFDIYHFLQGNARLYGGEISLHIKPSKKLAIESAFSTVTGKLEQDRFLPFIPADKLTTDLIFKFDKRVSWRTGADFVFPQQHPGDFETPTNQYWLLHSSLIYLLSTRKKYIRLSIAGENLLNSAYYDHLSRFKYYSIYNTGRNIMISCSVPLGK